MEAVSKIPIDFTGIWIRLVNVRIYGSLSSSMQEFSATSQNHRMVGVGRELCGSADPTLLPKQGHLQQ